MKGIIDNEFTELSFEDKHQKLIAQYDDGKYLILSKEALLVFWQQFYSNEASPSAEKQQFNHLFCRMLNLEMTNENKLSELMAHFLVFDLIQLNAKEAGVIDVLAHMQANSKIEPEQRDHNYTIERYFQFLKEAELGEQYFINGNTYLAYWFISMALYAVCNIQDLNSERKKLQSLIDDLAAASVYSESINLTHFRPEFYFIEILRHAGLYRASMLLDDQSRKAFHFNMIKRYLSGLKDLYKARVNDQSIVIWLHTESYFQLLKMMREIIFHDVNAVKVFDRAIAILNSYSIDKSFKSTDVGQERLFYLQQRIHQAFIAGFIQNLKQENKFFETFISRLIHRNDINENSLEFRLLQPFFELTKSLMLTDPIMHDMCFQKLFSPSRNLSIVKMQAFKSAINNKLIEEAKKELSLSFPTYNLEKLAACNQIVETLSNDKRSLLESLRAEKVQSDRYSITMRCRTSENLKAHSIFSASSSSNPDSDKLLSIADLALKNKAELIRREPSRAHTISKFSLTFGKNKAQLYKLAFRWLSSSELDARGDNTSKIDNTDYSSLAL